MLLPANGVRELATGQDIAMRLNPEAQGDAVIVSAERCGYRWNSAHADALIPTAGSRAVTHICYSCARPPETATRCYSKQNEMAMA